MSENIQKRQKEQLYKKSALGVIIISFIAFISLGLPDGLIGVAWPGIRSHFNLPLDALGLVLVFGTAGYMLSSFFSGIVVRKLGIGGLLSVSCGATASALLVYSITPFWWIFVISATLGGLGAGAIDAGLNTYVAQNHSERMMQWLHASFGIGVTSGPVIMTLGITLTSRWQTGYFVVAAAQGLLALTFFLTRSMWSSAEEKSSEQEHSKNGAPFSQTLKKTGALLSMLMFFIYVGVELGIGHWAYSLLTESRGVKPGVAGIITGSYWALFTAGRFLAGWYSRKIDVSRLLYFSMFLAIAGVGLIMINAGQIVTIIGIGLTGFAVAPIFPGLVSDTKNRVGIRHQANTIGMQIAAAGLGGAVVPSIAGVLARFFTLEVIPLYVLAALLLLLLSFFLSHVSSNRKG